MLHDGGGNNGKRLTWFRFFPSDWIEVLGMTEKQAGKRFKELITRLSVNKAPRSSIEESMIKDSFEYTEKKRLAALKRWREREMNRTQQPLPKNRQEVIDFAVDSGLEVDDAVTWAQINLRERKGKDKDGNPIVNWKAMCSAYCSAMAKKRESA